MAQMGFPHGLGFGVKVLEFRVWGLGRITFSGVPIRRAIEF